MYKYFEFLGLKERLIGKIKKVGTSKKIISVILYPIYINTKQHILAYLAAIPTFKMSIRNFRQCTFDICVSQFDFLKYGQHGNLASSI